MRKSTILEKKIIIMLLNLNRICIYAKDIAIITGKSYRQACRIHKTIRDYHHKKSGQYLSIKEFCDYTGIPQEVIEEKLK